MFGSIELLGVACALALAASHVHIERVGARRNAQWRPFRRDGSGRLAAGPVVLRVQLQSYDGGPVRVGTSVEPRHGHNVLPTLTCDAVTVRVIDGPKLKLRRDAKLRAENIDGAVRRTLELIDTPQGPRRVCAYELSPDKPLWLIGRLPREVRESKDGPFRGDTIGEIDPCGEHYVLSDQPPDRWISGCGVPIAALLLLLIGGFAIASRTSAWAFVAALGLAAYALQWLTLPSAAPADLAQSAATEVRVEPGESAANRDEPRADAPASSERSGASR